MKNVTLTIDLKSFCLGALSVGAVLLMANKPAAQPATPTQPCPDHRRFQAFVGKETRTLILDTQTGRFLLERPSVGLPGWAPLDFEQLYQKR